jgi:hypothetical protein
VRTTLSIDDDVLDAVRERAAREGRTLGEVLSALARLGLTARPVTPTETEFYGFRPLPPRGHPVTNAAIDRLREDEPE